MTLEQCASALITREVVQLDDQGTWGWIANITKAGKVQVRYCGRDRRPRVGVDPERINLYQITLASKG